MNKTPEDLIESPLTSSDEHPSILSTQQLEEKFYPSGAFVFFLLLIVLCMVIWFGIYFIMLERI